MHALPDTSCPLRLPRFEDNTRYIEWELEQISRLLLSYQDARMTQRPRAHVAQAERIALLQQQAIARRRELEAAGTSLPFAELSRRHTLSPEEERILWLCLADQLSPTLSELRESILDGPLTVSTACAIATPSKGLLSDARWWSPTGALRRFGLIHLDPPEGAALSSLISAPHYLSAAMCGERAVDALLARCATLSTPRRALYELVLPDALGRRTSRLIRGLRGASPAKAWVLTLLGPPQSGKSALADAISEALARDVFRLDLARVGLLSSPVEALHRAFENARYLDAVLHLVAPESALSDPRDLSELRAALADFRGLVILESSNSDAHVRSTLNDLSHFTLKTSRPDLREREALWESLIPRALDVAPDVQLGRLAAGFELVGGQIEAAIQWAQRTCEGRALTQQALEAGAEVQQSSQLDQFARISRVQLSMRDLILPEETHQAVEELLDACRTRHQVMSDWGLGERLVTGRGVVALFSGEAGTGKTLCAEILAQELGRELHIVQVPKIVSKWVGETEKNIREVFAQARAQGAMLLFDEADSLFSKRVKVERSQDKFQNMEVNNLLQEIERFDGVVILTTNLEANIDRAFERRILFKITFPIPEEAERLAIWQSLIPHQMPIAGALDFPLLAEAFELTGGQIKNAITRAALRSAKRHDGLTQEALEEAAHQQAVAAGRLTRPLHILREQRSKATEHHDEVDTPTAHHLQQVSTH